MGSRLVPLALLLSLVILVFCWISIDSEFYALETSVEADGRLDVAQARHKLAKPVVMEAEMLPEGRTVMLIPQYDDIVVREGQSFVPIDGAVDFKDGKYIYWGDMHPKRIWLFMVVSEERPEITVAH
jgi:hypothetical protein